MSKSEAKTISGGASGPHATYGDNNTGAGPANNQKNASGGGSLVMRSLEGYSYQPSSIVKAIVD